MITAYSFADLQKQEYTTLFQFKRIIDSSWIYVFRCEVLFWWIWIGRKKISCPLKHQLVIHQNRPLFISHYKILSQKQLFAKNLNGENIRNWVNCEYTILTCNFTAVIVLPLWKLYHYLKQRFLISRYSIIFVWRMSNNVFIRLFIKWIFFEDSDALCSTVQSMAWSETIHHFVLGPKHT